MTSLWIDCMERMPDLKEIEPNFWTSEFVLVARKDDFYGSFLDIMQWYGSPDDMHWHDGNDIWLGQDQVTHWMPTPELPERRSPESTK